MGHIIGPFGVHGWIKINPYTEYIDGLLDYSSWWLGKDDSAQWQEVRVDTGRVSGNNLIAKLEEYTDRTQAASLNGMLIAIPRNQLPKLPENGADGYYWSDLIGTEVINLKAVKLGNVIGLFETGANDVLRVHGKDNNAKEILIPFLDQFIITIDLKKNQIVVDWEPDY